VNGSTEDPFLAGAEILAWPLALVDVEAAEIDVDSIDAAVQILRHLGRIERQAAADRALYEVEKAKLDAWLADRTSGPERAAARLRDALTRWALAQVADNPRGPKSWDLPAGKIRSTAGRASLQIDPAVLTDDAARALGLTVTEERVLGKTEMIGHLREQALDLEKPGEAPAELVTADGELVPVPGVTWTTKGRTVTVTPEPGRLLGDRP
jgi:hypothetical protein